jgi:hypothetical protein
VASKLAARGDPRRPCVVCGQRSGIKASDELLRFFELERHTSLV